VRPQNQFSQASQSIAQMNKLHLEEVKQNQTRIAQQPSYAAPTVSRSDTNMYAARSDSPNQVQEYTSDAPPPLPIHVPIARPQNSPSHTHSLQSQQAIQAYQAETKYVSQLQQTHRAEKEALNHRNAILLQEANALKSEITKLKEIAKSKEWFDSRNPAPSPSTVVPQSHKMNGLIPQFRDKKNCKEIGIQSEENGLLPRIIHSSGVSNSQRVFDFILDLSYLNWF
jgi:hypothetical protein